MVAAGELPVVVVVDWGLGSLPSAVVLSDEVGLLGDDAPFCSEQEED